MNANEYQCYVCKGVFEKTLTDGEAAAQLSEEFPGAKPEECELICDDIVGAGATGFGRHLITQQGRTEHLYNYERHKTRSVN